MCQSGHMCGRFTVRKTYLIVIDNTLKSFAPQAHTHTYTLLSLAHFVFILSDALAPLHSHNCDNGLLPLSSKERNYG